MNLFRKMLSPRGGAEGWNLDFSKRQQVAAFNFLQRRDQWIADTNVDLDTIKGPSIESRLDREPIGFNALGRKLFFAAFSYKKNEPVFVRPS